MGVSRDFAGRTFHVTLRSGRRVWEADCSAKDLALTVDHLAELAHRFPWASVRYYPEPDGDVVAEIHCICDDVVRRSCCHHGDDRPTLTIQLAEPVDACLVPE